MSVSEQGRNFALFFIIGLLIGFLFDIFRGFRKNFKLPNLLVDIQDILFLVLSGLFYFRSIIVFNHGDLRFYLIFATAIGIAIYALTLSESCVIIIDVIFRIIKLPLKMIWKLMASVNGHFRKKKHHSKG